MHTETDTLTCDLCGTEATPETQIGLDLDTGHDVCPDCQSAEDMADDCDIQPDDWITEEGNQFYQNGTLILDATDMTDKQAARAAALIMKRQQYWPNVWFISDHGNVHSFTF